MSLLYVMVESLQLIFKALQYMAKLAIFRIKHYLVSSLMIICIANTLNIDSDNTNLLLLICPDCTCMSAECSRVEVPMNVISLSSHKPAEAVIQKKLLKNTLFWSMNDPYSTCQAGIALVH